MSGSNESAPRTLSAIGEDAAIAALVKVLGNAGAPSLGPGDDCAVIEMGDSHEWQLTSDPIVAGIHFLPDADPRLVGRKAVGRALSDIAAMGGQPKWFLINITAPGELSLDQLKAIYRGARQLTRKYGATIVGGDLGKGSELALHVFAIGQAPVGTSIRRDGARRGDIVYVTGQLGGSMAGRHFTFEPRIREGVWLRKQGGVTAMMDVSDGLATDLPRLLKRSGVSALLQERAIPIAPAARRIDDEKTPLLRALTDGEDFELVFTVSPERASALEAAWRNAFRLRLSQIGEIVSGDGQLFLEDKSGQRQQWTAAGFEHFRS